MATDLRTADRAERRSTTTSAADASGVRRLLVVCTANVCRSPVVAARFAERIGSGDGERWVVSSAGTTRVGALTDPSTSAVAAAAGLDLTGHRPRVLDRHVLATDGADLVVTMTREHVRDVVALDPTAWPRTFTLKELARRASEQPPAAPDEAVERWRTRIAVDRRATAMMRPDPGDDVSDPYRRPLDAHEAMLREVTVLVDLVLRSGPWQR